MANCDTVLHEEPLSYTSKLTTHFTILSLEVMYFVAPLDHIAPTLRNPAQVVANQIEVVCFSGFSPPSTSPHLRDPKGFPKHSGPSSHGQLSLNHDCGNTVAGPQRK